MDSDDRSVGRLLTRREAVRLLSVSGLVLGAWDHLVAQTGGGLSQCVVLPQLEEGPYFVDKQATRSDIRTDTATGAQKPGVPLALAFAVAQVSQGRCSPLPKAIVDIWQCDALGAYAGTQPATRNQTFLRGIQQTDDRGSARFVTIYPGWYSGRAVHIHFKVRTQTATGQAYEFTSQLFLPENLTDQIHAQSPYVQRGHRDTPNERDRIYRAGGPQLLLQPAKSQQGYEAAFNIALDLSDMNVGRPDGQGGRGFNR